MKLTDTDLEKRSRLKAFLDAKSIDRQQFALEIGAKKGYVAQLLSGNRKISDSVMFRLSNRYTDLNIDWLRTGSGEMLTENIELNGVQEPRMDYVPTPPELKIEDTTEWRLKALEEQVEALWKVIHELREGQRME